VPVRSLPPELPMAPFSVSPVVAVEEPLAPPVVEAVVSLQSM